MKKVIDDNEYVLRDFLQWGEQLDASQEVVDEVVRDMSVIPGESPKIQVKRVDVKKAQMKQVLKSMISWTFRGYGEDGTLKREGEILEINNANLATIPASHGTALSKIVDKLNTIEEEVSKK